jgi:hypothetical protein
MPNWCNNTLELAHKDPAMIVRARDAFNRQELLQEFIPVPKELQIVAGRVSDEAEQAKLEADTARNVEVYGYGNWYDYCVNEWGTKWDVGAEGYEVEVENGRLTMSFDSAWSPPIAAYEKLMELGFEVRAYYYESGMCFAGIWDDGCDDFYDLSQCRNADEMEDLLPTVLDEMFCISEGMREYEEEMAEEEEELYTWTKEGAEAKAKNE